MNQTSRIVSLVTAAVAVLLPIGAAAASFTDIPADSPIAPAAAYLQSKGIVQDAAKFNPDAKLNRAQAAKVLVAPLVSAEDLQKITTSTFGDVPPGQWYTSYVEAARKLGLVDTAPKFNPEAPVTKAAFMKMLFKAKALDYNSAYSDFTRPLSSDVASSKDWFYPIIRYGLATSMTAVSGQGKLNPAGDITRGSMALLYYRLDMYQEGRRTQALLSQTETDIGNIIQMLDQKQADEADWAAARAVIAARGALTSKPDEGIVKGAMKVAEGFQSLVAAYRAGTEGRLQDSVDAAKTAYTSADKAKAFAPTLGSIADQMQQIAKKMADEARALMNQPK